jgi:hypothetical protein
VQEESKVRICSNLDDDDAVILPPEVAFGPIDIQAFDIPKSHRDHLSALFTKNKLQRAGRAIPCSARF